MNWEEERLLYKVAKLYYEDNCTQQEIAEETGIYRTTVSRMLKKAYKKGIVKIEVQSPFSEQFQLEEEIAAHFGLKEVIIVASNVGQTNESIAKACFGLLNRIMTDDDILGLSWGTSVGLTSNYPAVVTPKAITCVPLVGGAGKMDVEHHINAIVHNFSNTFQGKATFIDAAAIYETKETANEIIHSEFMRKLIGLWDQLTVAVVGVGASTSSSNMVWSGFLGEQEQMELQKNNAVGDILSRFYTRDGNVIKSPISERTIALQLETLRNLRYSIGVAYSKEKAQSIMAAMRGGFINALVTNEDTALEIKKIIQAEQGGV